MNRLVIICFLLLVVTISSDAQNKTHVIKTDTKINALFQGEGFVIESVGYEYMPNMQHSVGFRLGWKFNTSKMEIDEEGKATTYRNLLFAIEHYYFPFKNHYSSGVYIFFGIGV